MVFGEIWEKQNFEWGVKAFMGKSVITLEYLLHLEK